LILLTEARHQVAIAGRLTDAVTGTLLAGCRVQLTSVPAAFAAWLASRALEIGARWESLPVRPDRAVTQGDGHFHFLDLPDGQYTVAASLPPAGTRYGTAQVGRTISRDAGGTIARQTADLALPPTTVRGRVTGPGNVAVQLAWVRVRGGVENTYTDGLGEYVLTALEAGSRALLVSASGFQPSPPVSVSLQVGTVATMNVSLLV
jgi:hypothetical protein